MSAVVSAVGSAFSGIGKAVSSVVQGAGKVVSGIVQGITKDPLTAIAKVAAVATGQLWAIPLIDGVSVLAQGGSIGDALKAGAASAVSSWVAGAIPFASAIGNATLASAARQAVQGGLSTLIRTGDVGKALTAAGAGALQGGIGSAIGQSGIGQSIAGATGIAATGDLVSRSLSGALTAAAQGKDAGEGAARGFTSSLFNWADKGIQSVTNNVSDFIQANQDLDPAGSQQLLDQNSQVAELGSQLNDIQNQYSEIQKTADAQNEQFQEISAQYNNATGEARELAQAAANEFKPASEQLQSLIDNYNTVKENYDKGAATDEEVEAAANAANEYYESADYKNAEARYQSATNDLNTAHQANIDSYNQALELQKQLQGSVDQLGALDNQGKQLGSQLTEKAAALQKETAAYEERVSQQTINQLATAGANLDQWGREIGPNGETISRFDDGSILVTDKDGNSYSYDDAGQIYNAKGERSAPNEQQGSLLSLLRSTPQAAAQRARTIAARRQPSTASPQTAPNSNAPLAAAALPAAGLATQLGKVSQADPTITHDLSTSQQPVAKPMDYDLFSFLKEGPSKMINIPGVTSQQNKPMDYGLIDPTQTQNVLPQQTDYLGSSPLSSLNNQEQPAAPTDDFSGGLAEGGFIPQFYSEGGMENSYVGTRDGDGTADKVPALLSSNEYVISADAVSALGNGSPDRGAAVLDAFVKAIRRHRNSGGDELPPESLSPLQYLQQSMKGA